MICKKCGKEIPDGAVFCSYCGCDLRKTISSNHDTSLEEQIPLLILAKQIAKHKIAVIVSVIAVSLAIGGYVAFKNQQEKKEAEALIMQEIEHIFSIVGTYKNSDIKLVLSSDNTARITINLGSYNECSYRGYWKEKAKDYPIEIDFSDSFEVYIGSKKRYSCSTLYLYDNRLWESMSAIRSYDYNASESLTKE